MAGFREFQLLISEFILDELRRVWLEKFGVPEEEIDKRETWLRSVAESVSPGTQLNLVKRKDSDNRILECAVEGKADYLITGDETDLLPLGKVEGIPIVEPRKAYALLRGEN